jgi:hypothetical protein
MHFRQKNVTLNVISKNVHFMKNLSRKHALGTLRLDCLNLFQHM